MDYYILFGNERRGPYSREALREMRITAATLLWREGLTDWTPAGGLPELYDILEPATGAPQYVAEPAPPMPKTWLAESILVTLLCCMPCGVVGIIYAAQVSSRYAAGDYDAAAHNSRIAGIWTKVGFFSVLILYVLGGLIYLLAFGIAGVGLLHALD